MLLFSSPYVRAFGGCSRLQYSRGLPYQQAVWGGEEEEPFEETKGFDSPHHASPGLVHVVSPSAPDLVPDLVLEVGHVGPNLALGASVSLLLQVL